MAGGILYCNYTVYTKIQSASDKLLPNKPYTDVVCINVAVHGVKVDSAVIIGQDVGVAVLGSVLRKKRGILTMVQTNGCHSLQQRDGKERERERDRERKRKRES